MIPDPFAPTQSPQTMPDGPGESFEAYRAKLDDGRECRWFVSGGLYRAYCERLDDGRHPGRSLRPSVCPVCGALTMLDDK